jgi:hypothetical protein
MRPAAWDRTVRALIGGAARHAQASRPIRTGVAHDHGILKISSGGR